MINHLHRAANNNLPLLLSISIFVHIWFPFDFFQLLNNWRSLYFHSLLILRPSLGRTGGFLVAEANPEFYDCTIQQGPPRDTPPKKKKVRKLCSLIKMSSPPPRPQIGSSQAATLTHKRLTLRDWGDVVLMRLTPIPVRPSGHTVHCAPDTQGNQHPGDGAASHTVEEWLNESRMKLQVSRCYYTRIWKCYFKYTQRTRLQSDCALSAASQPAPSVLLCSLRPQCAGYHSVLGVIYLGMAYFQAEEGRCNNERDYPRRRGAGRLLRNKDHSYVMLLRLAFASFNCLFACLFLCLKKNCSKITFHHADYQT